MSPLSSKRRPTPKSNVSVLNRTLMRSNDKKQVPFLNQKKVPAGDYQATIVSVSDAVTNGGDEAIDIVYELLDEAGRTFEVKERMAFDGYPFRMFVDHLFDAGLLREGASSSEMVGICEEVTVAYPYKGAIGNFQNRRPCQQKSSSPNKAKRHDLLQEDSEDDDDEDILEDEED